MSDACLVSPAPIVELFDVLEGAGPPQLDEDIRTALVGPDAAADPAVARYVGSVLTQLADRGETDLLTTYLAPEPGCDATYDVEVLGLGELIATQRVGGLNVVDAVREAVARTGEGSSHVAVLAWGTNGLGRRVLSAPPEGPLEYVYPGLLSFEGERRLERHALEAWEVQLAQWRDEAEADLDDAATALVVVSAAGDGAASDGVVAEDRHVMARRRLQLVGDVVDVVDVAAEDLGGPKGDEDMVAERSFVKVNGHSRWSLPEHNGHDGVAQLAWSATEGNVTRSPAVELAQSLRSALGTADAVAGCVVSALERDGRTAELAEPLRSALGTAKAVTRCVVSALERDGRAAGLAEPLRSAVRTAEAVTGCVIAGLERDGPAAQLAEPLRSAVHTVSAIAGCVATGLEGERPHVPAPSADEEKAPVVLPTRPESAPPAAPTPPARPLAPVAAAPAVPSVAPTAAQPAPPAPSSEDLGGRLEEVCQGLADLRQDLSRLGDDQALLLKGAQAMVRLEQAIEIGPPTALDEGGTTVVEPDRPAPPLVVVDDGDRVPVPPGAAVVEPEGAGPPLVAVADGDAVTTPDVEGPAVSERGSHSARTDLVALDPRQVDELVDAVALRLRDLFEFVDDGERAWDSRILTPEA